MTSVFLPDQVDRLVQRQQDTRLGLAISGLTVGLLAIIAIKELKGLFREERGRGRWHGANPTARCRGALAYSI